MLCVLLFGTGNGQRQGRRDTIEASLRDPMRAERYKRKRFPGFSSLVVVNLVPDTARLGQVRSGVGVAGL